MNVRTPSRNTAQPRSAWPLVACAVLLLTLPACSDDDGDNGGPGDVSTADTTPDIQQTDATDDAATSDVDAGVEDASAQIIYEIPDPAASEVDLFVNKQLVADNIQFRQATEYVNLDADTELSIEVATPTAGEFGSEDTTLEEAEATFGPPVTTTLSPGSTNQLVIHGVANQRDFSDGGIEERDIGFALGVHRGARTEPNNFSGQTETVAFHAVFDAPTVDLYPDNRQDAAFSELEYGSFNDDYVDFEEGRHVFDITAAGNRNAIVQTFQTEQYQSEQVLTFVLSGALSDVNIDEGAARAQVVAYPPEASGDDNLVDGRVTSRAARAQFIHTSPDSRLTTVDVFFDESRRLDEFTFREATNFRTLPADIPIDVSFTEPAATDTEEPLAEQEDFSFPAGSTRVYAVSGVLNPGNWEGSLEELGLTFRAGTAMNVVPPTSGDNPTPQVALQVFNGSTDAGTLRPELDVPGDDTTTNLTPLNYPQFLSDVRGDGEPRLLEATDRILTVRNDAGTAIGSSFSFPLSDARFSGTFATVVVTGVRTAEGDPADAEPFQVFVVTQSGETVDLVSAN